MPAYDDAVQALARVPLASFVAERKRLAGTLRAAGDKAAAKALAGRRRPSTSAWAVNQLYWEARETFDALLAAAERMRRGERAAAGEHRTAMSALRQRGAAILEQAGHAATEVTLRRMTNTLAALAVAGGFAPDVAGALTDDRDPPGFEAMATMVSGDDADAREARAAVDDEAHERQRAAAAEAARRAAEEAERARTAERARLDADLRAARATLDRHEAMFAAAHRALRDAETQVAASRDAVAALERARAALGDDEV